MTEPIRFIGYKLKTGHLKEYKFTLRQNINRDAPSCNCSKVFSAQQKHDGP